MWFNLGATKGAASKVAALNRNSIETEMTPQQIEKAQEIARNWKPTSN